MCIYGPFSTLKKFFFNHWRGSVLHIILDSMNRDDMAEELLWSLGVGRHLPAYLQKSRHRSQPLDDGRGTGTWWNMESFPTVALGQLHSQFLSRRNVWILLILKGTGNLICMWFVPAQKIFVESTVTLLVTSISHQKSLLKMIFLFPRWDMLVPWRVEFFFLPLYQANSSHDIQGMAMIHLQRHRQSMERWCTTFGWLLIYAVFPKCFHPIHLSIYIYIYIKDIDII